MKTHVILIAQAASGASSKGVPLGVRQFCKRFFGGPGGLFTTSPPTHAP